MAFSVCRCLKIYFNWIYCILIIQEFSACIYRHNWSSSSPLNVTWQLHAAVQNGWNAGHKGPTSSICWQLWAFTVHFIRLSTITVSNGDDGGGCGCTSMEQSLSLEPSSHSASQGIPPLLMEPEGSLPCSQKPASGLYPEPESSSPYLTILLP
jgi:hypothetical protein